jgi:hypothetical protein
MSYQNENSVLFSLSNLQQLATASGPSLRKHQPQRPPPGEATNFFNIGHLVSLDSAPASAISPAMLISPARLTNNNWLFATMISLGVLLLISLILTLVILLPPSRPVEVRSITPAVTSSPPPKSKPVVSSLASASDKKPAPEPAVTPAEVSKPSMNSIPTVPVKERKVSKKNYSSKRSTRHLVRRMKHNKKATGAQTKRPRSFARSTKISSSKRKASNDLDALIFQ